MKIDRDGVNLLVQEPALSSKSKTGEGTEKGRKASQIEFSEAEEAEFEKMTRMTLELGQKIVADADSALAAVGEIQTSTALSLTEQGFPA